MVAEPEALRETGHERRVDHTAGDASLHHHVARRCWERFAGAPVVRASSGDAWLPSDATASHGTSAATPLAYRHCSLTGHWGPVQCGHRPPSECRIHRATTKAEGPTLPRCEGRHDGSKQIP